MARNALINFIILACAIGAGLATSREPWVVLKSEGAIAQSKIRQMRASEKEHEELVRKQARLQGSLGTEELVRSRGLIPANEVLADRP